MTDPVSRNRERVAQKMRRRYHWLRLYKTTVGCAECGYKKNGNALQFAHIDPSTKHKSVSYLVNCKLKAMFDEIRKCRVLCMNCHVEETDAQRKAQQFRFGRPMV